MEFDNTSILPSYLGEVGAEWGVRAVNGIQAVKGVSFHRAEGVGCLSKNYLECTVGFM